MLLRAGFRLPVPPRQSFLPGADKNALALARPPIIKGLLLAASSSTGRSLQRSPTSHAERNNSLSQDAAYKPGFELFFQGAANLPDSFRRSSLRKGLRPRSAVFPCVCRASEDLVPVASLLLPGACEGSWLQMAAKVSQHTTSHHTTSRHTTHHITSHRTKSYHITAHTTHHTAPNHIISHYRAPGKAKMALRNLAL